MLDIQPQKIIRSRVRLECCLEYFEDDKFHWIRQETIGRLGLKPCRTLVTLSHIREAEILYVDTTQALARNPPHPLQSHL
jgi:hypothetical protein